jgi:hypothetical protein
MFLCTRELSRWAFRFSDSPACWKSTDSHTAHTFESDRFKNVTPNLFSESVAEIGLFKDVNSSYHALRHLPNDANKHVI